MVVAFGEDTIIIYKVSVAVGLGNLPMEGLSFKRTPATAADNVAGCELPRMVLHHNEVSFHSFADITAVLDIDKVGGIVAH